jgi:hypothetical protein
MLEQAVYSVGTAATTVVAPTIDSAHYVLKNIEPTNEMGDFSRQGYAYGVSRYLTLPNNGTAIFSFTTGDTGAQFDFWDFQAGNSNVLGELIEGATITATATAVPAYNLNRNEPDDYEAVLTTATALTGGTVVLSEFIGASNQASGGVSSSKIVTLEPNTQYGFRFRDIGGNGTPLHVQIGFVEFYNGYNEIWLDTINDSYVLRGGEEVSMYLRPYETINATAQRDGCQLAVMRQD